MEKPRVYSPTSCTTSNLELNGHVISTIPTTVRSPLPVRPRRPNRASSPRASSDISKHPCTVRSPIRARQRVSGASLGLPTPRRVTERPATRRASPPNIFRCVTVARLAITMRMRPAKAGSYANARRLRSRLSAQPRSACAMSSNDCTNRPMSSCVCATETSHCSSSPGGVRMPRLTPHSQLSSAVSKSVRL